MKGVRNRAKKQGNPPPSNPITHVYTVCMYILNTQATAGQTIDIWWVAKDGGLLLLVPYLLKLHVLWKRYSTTILYDTYRICYIQL